MLTEADTVNDVIMMFPGIRDIFQNHSKLLRERRVSLNDLVFTKRTSKNYDEYQDRNTVENNAILNLHREGKSLRAGEILKYIITDYYRRNSKKRSVPVELTNSQTRYDVKRYCEILTEVTNTITQPFGLTVEDEFAN